MSFAAPPAPEEAAPLLHLRQNHGEDAGALDPDAERDLSAARSRLGDAFPIGGWLAAYMRAVTPLTSAPIEFHLAAGIAVVAAVLGNRLYVEMWGQRIYPHLWTVVVARSGFMHKSTSMGIAERLLRDAGLADILYPHEATREAALDAFRDNPAGLMVLDEFGAFLAVNARDYQAGFLEQLTELYGREEFRRKTKGGGDLVIRQPAINIFAATTIDWLEERVTPALLRGGFLYRCLFVSASEKASERDFERMDSRAHATLIRGLRRVATFGRTAGAIGASEPIEVQFTAEARAAVQDWFRGWEREAGGRTGRQDLIGFAVRLQTSMLKLAMVFRAAACAFDESLDPTLIDSAAVTGAIAYVRIAWQNDLHIFDNEFAPDREARVRRSILDKIGRGCTQSTLLRRTHMKARDLDDWIGTLVQTREVTRRKIPASKAGLDRQRDREVTWLEPGPEHPAEVQRRRANKTSAQRAAEREWDEAVARTQPIVFTDPPPQVTAAQDAVLDELFEEPSPKPQAGPTAPGSGAMSGTHAQHGAGPHVDARSLSSPVCPDELAIPPDPCPLCGAALPPVWQGPLECADCGWYDPESA